jgi:hypothetical protein
VFYFQSLLNQALSGIDSTGMMPTIVSIAYGILLVGFLIGLYQAVMRGGDVQSLGITAIKYLAVAIIVANWSTVFHDVNNSFNSVAQMIGNSSGDVFLSWDKQLGQQFSDSSISWWDIISGDIAALISVFLIVIAYIFYVVAIVLFCFFYSMFGSVLYVAGPLIISLLPMTGVGQLAKTFGLNVMIWNSWGIIYAIFGALITAIHMNQVSDGVGSFLGFFQGPVDSVLLGLISIFYAIGIAAIPFLAKRVISGDVGAAALSMVRAAATAAGVLVAGASGFAVGAGGTATPAASSSASGASGGASTSGGAASPAAAGAAPMSSSTPPPTPAVGVGASIHAAMSGAMSSSTSPSSPNVSGASAANTSSGSAAATGRSGSDNSGVPYRPHGVAQTIAYHAAKSLGRSVTAPSEA